MENWMEKWRHFYHDFQTNNLKMLEPAAPWRTHQVAVIGHVGHCHALGQQFPCDSLVGSPVLGTVMMPCWSLEKNLRNVTCHVGLAYGCIYIYIYILIGRHTHHMYHTCSWCLIKHPLAQVGTWQDLGTSPVKGPKVAHIPAQPPSSFDWAEKKVFLNGPLKPHSTMFTECHMCSYHIIYIYSKTILCYIYISSYIIYI